jgi:hypothetical protein
MYFSGPVQAEQLHAALKSAVSSALADAADPRSPIPGGPVLASFQAAARYRFPVLAGHEP